MLKNLISKRFRTQYPLLFLFAAALSATLLVYGASFGADASGPVCCDDNPKCKCDDYSCKCDTYDCRCGSDGANTGREQPKERQSNLQNTLNSLLEGSGGAGSASGGPSGGQSGVSCEDNPNCYCYDSCYCAPNDCRCEDEDPGGG